MARDIGRPWIVTGAAMVALGVSTLIGLLVLLATPAAADVAHASGQTVCANGGSDCSSDDEGVMERPRPEYDAKGIPMGGFRLFPSLDASGTYDDNVLRQSAAQSDVFVVVAPTVRLQSQWGEHFVEIYGGVDNFDYLKFSRLDLTDWVVGTDGRLDILRAAYFSANLNYGQQHEALGSPNTIGSQASANRYYLLHAGVDAPYQSNRLGFDLGASLDQYDFLDTPLLGGGTLDNSDRNETEAQSFAKISYDFSPGYSAFVKATYDARHFEHYFDRSGVHRDSTGYRLNGGIDARISNLLRGEVSFGYLEQNYAQNLPRPLKDATGLDYAVALDWYAARVLTVHLNGSRQLSDSVLSGVSVSKDSLIKLSADYEFQYNILVQPFVSFTSSQYVGTSRTDNLPGAGIGVKYLLNRYLSTDLNYTYSNRSSNDLGVKYTDSMVSIGLTGHI